MVKGISDVSWLLKLNLQRPRSFCLCQLHHLLWEEARHQAKSQSILRPLCSQEDQMSHIEKQHGDTRSVQAVSSRPALTQDIWVRNLQRPLDPAALGWQAHEKCPRRTAQLKLINLQDLELFTIYCLKLPSFVAFSYTAINNRNNYSFQEACDGIKKYYK